MSVNQKLIKRLIRTIVRYEDQKCSCHFAPLTVRAPTRGEALVRTRTVRTLRRTVIVYTYVPIRHVRTHPDVAAAKDRSRTQKLLCQYCTVPVVSYFHLLTTVAPTHFFHSAEAKVKTTETIEKMSFMDKVKKMSKNVVDSGAKTMLKVCLLCAVQCSNFALLVCCTHCTVQYHIRYYGYRYCIR